MSSSANKLAIQNFFVTLRPLQERAKAFVPEDFASLCTDVGAMLADLRQVCENDREVLSSLAIAQILLSMGHPELALVKIRAILILRGA